MFNILRKLLFPLFVLIYIIFCPLIILRALGIIFTPESTKSLTTTGLISLNTIPPGAIIELNGLARSERTPTVINNLQPGTFEIRLSLPHYRSWQQKLNVEASHATSLENIILIPESWTKELLSAQPFQNLLPMDGNPFIILRNGNQLSDLAIYRWPEGLEGVLPPKKETDKDKVVPLFSPASAYWNAEILSIVHIPQSSHFLVTALLDSQEKYLWVDPREDKTKVNDLTDLFSQKDLPVIWEPQRTNEIFTLAESEISRLSIEERAIFPKICRDMRGYGLANKRIYGLTDSAIGVFDYEGNGTLSFSHPPGLAALLTETKTSFKIYSFSDNFFALLSTSGQLLVNKPPYLILDRGVLGLLQNPKTRQVFFWTRQSIGIINPALTDDKTIADDIAISWPVQKSRDIEQVYLVNEGTHLLYRDQNAVYLVDLSSHLQAPKDELLRIKPNSDIRYSEKTGKIIFMNEKDGTLMNISLYPMTFGLPSRMNKKDETK